MKQAPVWTKDGFTLRLGRKEEAERYYEENFHPLDPEISRLTGCKPLFSREEVVSFFLRCVDDADRYDFLLLSPDGRIIGESVINEIDWTLSCANYRVAIFDSKSRGAGLGSWMVETCSRFAFADLKLRRLSLEVFSFNPRAIHVYEAAGFRREGVLRKAVQDGAAYGDIILMSMP